MRVRRCSNPDQRTPLCIFMQSSNACPIWPAASMTSGAAGVSSSAKKLPKAWSIFSVMPQAFADVSSRVIVSRGKVVCDLFMMFTICLSSAHCSAVPSLLDRDPVRASRPGRKGSVEVEIEPRIEHKVVVCNPGHVNLMVAFSVDLAEVVFVQEVVADDEPLLIRRERDV